MVCAMTAGEAWGRAKYWFQPLGQSDEFRELQRERRKLWLAVSLEY